MKQYACIVFAVLALNAASASAAETMRVDYYHTGNSKEERFSLDRVVIEPLPWAGNPSRPARRHEPRQVFLRGRRRRDRHDALFAGVQLDLRRVGNDRRGAAR